MLYMFYKPMWSGAVAEQTDGFMSRTQYPEVLVAPSAPVVHSLMTLFAATHESKHKILYHEPPQQNDNDDDDVFRSRVGLHVTSKLTSTS